MIQAFPAISQRRSVVMDCCLDFMVDKSRVHHCDASMQPRERFIGKKKGRVLAGLDPLLMAF